MISISEYWTLKHDWGFEAKVGKVDAPQNNFPISYLSEDGISVVGKDYAAHGIEEHLQHGLGAESGSHDVWNSLNKGLGGGS